MEDLKAELNTRIAEKNAALIQKDSALAGKDALIQELSQKLARYESEAGK